MRILVINWQDRLNPQAGGAEVHLHEIFGRLAARGHRISLLASGWPGAPREAEVDGLRVVRAGTRYTFPLRARPAFHRLAAEERPELVVEDINKLPLFTPRWSEVPVVGLVPHLFGTTAFRQESWPVAATVWLAERLMPAVYRRVPFQAISDSTAEDLVRRGFDRRDIRVIPPGMDHERFRVDPAVPREAAPTLAYVGRLRRYKGLDVVLRALALLVRRGTGARMWIAGRGDDRTRLEGVARREGVADRVEFLGYVTEERKVDLLRRCWVHVYPSPKEGWGITNVEAAACGTPSVASDSPGLRDSVQDGASGFLVPHADPAAWAGRLERLLADAGLRARMGRDALRHAARFTWEATADETERALTEALADTDRSRRPAARRRGGRASKGA